MDKRVTILLPNARRQNVRVTANMTLLEILETACSKHGYDAEEHCLKFHNKEVGLTQQFRFSGLPNNCVLEMEPTEKRRTLSNVVVCVQLNDGSRQQADFSPNDSLWQVVQKLCETQVKGYESPVIIYMRSEVIGQEQMHQTTLKSLGILEGRAMMRLIDKKPEDLKTQANVYKAPAAKTPVDNDDQPSTSRSAMAASGGGGGFALTSNMIKNLKRTAPEENASGSEPAKPSEKSDQEQQPQAEAPKYDWGSGSGYSMHHAPEQKQAENEAEENPGRAPPVVNVIGPRQAVLFSLDETAKHADDLPDSFFDLTVNDLKMVLRDLKRTSSGDDDAPLLTAKLRELERQKTMLAKLNQYKDCVLRIQFPDRFVLQGIFKPHEPLSKVEEFVREFLAQPGEQFHLFTIPPKKVLPTNETLLELNFVPNAIVHFGFLKDSLNAVSNRFVKEQYVGQLTSEEGAHYAVQKYRLTRVTASGTS
ncbi:tether containing UBX domain for GLUT4 [Drosophila rhopaloa]|uniref:Tether containing UBX domain for GLUT4 n=1 Tax=Drosophila rhopaloa TaxID=1041015 RepID=A0A6P4FI43_DRORH|nr:tether containing UBX domain for GLUT4 [Drosophila rhopaloa]XP_016987114.1 tether containing UBX domain for GLUT4 [Drosophila rhopaloa]